MCRAGGYRGRVSAAPKPDSKRGAATARWPRVIPGLVAIVVAATAAVLAAVALLEPPGWVLAVLCLLAALALAGAAAIARSLTLAVVAAVLAVTSAVGASGLALGARADASGGAAYDFPLVVGLPLTQARHGAASHRLCAGRQLRPRFDDHAAGGQPLTAGGVVLRGVTTTTARRVDGPEPDGDNRRLRETSIAAPGLLDAPSTARVVARRRDASGGGRADRRRLLRCDPPALRRGRRCDRRRRAGVSRGDAARAAVAGRGAGRGGGRRRRRSRSAVRRRNRGAGRRAGSRTCPRLFRPGGVRAGQRRRRRLGGPHERPVSSGGAGSDRDRVARARRSRGDDRRHRAVDQRGIQLGRSVADR